jgi:drug/metabolite transporter (DMT)-like permease
MPKHLTTNGAFIAWLGVILLAPDAMLIRFSGLDGFGLLCWRGLLMGLTLFALWLSFGYRNIGADLRVARSPVGLLLIVVYTADAVAFAIGITMTSATVMLTGLATMPIFTVLFSIPMLGERPDWRTWLTVMLCTLGILVVVLSGHEAVGAPTGSPVIGGLMGVLAAAGLGFAMVLKRRHPELPIMLSTGTANMLTVLLAWLVMSRLVPDLPQGAQALGSLMVMGVLVLPLAFFALMVAPRYTSATTVGLIMLTESIMGPFWVWVGTGERPSWLMVFGSAIVIGSLAYYFLAAKDAVEPENKLGDKSGAGVEAGE